MKQATRILIALFASWLVCHTGNTGDAKDHPVVLTGQKISAADIAFGEQQLRQLITDRQEIKKIVEPQSVLWKWTVRQFAGEGLHQRIYWNAENMSDKTFEFYAEHNSPTPEAAGYIRLRKNHKDGKPVSADRLASGMVYELFNIQNSTAFDNYFESALAGKLTEEQWIESNTKLEFLAERKSAEFYRRIYLPMAKAKHFSTDPSYWGADRPDTYPAWRAQYTDKSEYPWSFWGTWYRNEIVPYLKATRNIK